MSGAGPSCSDAVSPTGGALKRRRRHSGSQPHEPGSRSSHGRRVVFNEVRIRYHTLEVWGGGGVPADDGPPLGLSWDVQGEHSTSIDDYEDERSASRTPKDSYCMEGCVEPAQRRQMLLGSGSTLKAIKAATRQVAELNQERWKASEVLFGDAWLFRAPRHADAAELLAMLGQPEGRGAHLTVANWDSVEA